MVTLKLPLVDLVAACKVLEMDFHTVEEGESCVIFSATGAWDYSYVEWHNDRTGTWEIEPSVAMEYAVRLRKELEHWEWAEKRMERDYDGEKAPLQRVCDLLLAAVW
jgi:hypothetical protein